MATMIIYLMEDIQIFMDILGSMINLIGCYFIFSKFLFLYQVSIFFQLNFLFINEEVIIYLFILNLFKMSMVLFIQIISL